MFYEDEHVNRIISQLDEQGHLFKGFSLSKVDGKPECIGTGGFGIVFEMSFDKKPSSKYALKVIGFGEQVVTSKQFGESVRIQWVLSQDSQYICRIISAKEILVKLNDQDEIVNVEDSIKERWQEEGLHLQFVLMEKLDAIITKDKYKNVFLEREELRNEESVVAFGIQVASALMLAHNNSVLHRDVKLENIFWSESDQCYKLGDFGIAKFTEGGNANTIVYSDGYGAPEIERKRAQNYNATADIYSLGITMYILLNNLCFPLSNEYVARNVQYTQGFVLPPLQNISTDLNRVLQKMCAYESSNRYQSVNEVISELHNVEQKLLMAKYPDYYNNIDAENNEYDYLEDLATETARGNSRKNANVNNVSEDSDLDLDVESAGEYTTSKKKTRAERKLAKEGHCLYYNYKSRHYLIGFSILFALFFRSIFSNTLIYSNYNLANANSTNVFFGYSFEFWALPIALIVEAFLLKIREFHLIFGAVTLALGGYIMYSFGINLPTVILLICLLISFPIFTAGAGIGAGIWIFLLMSGSLGFLEWLYKLDLGWIFLIAIVFLLDRYFYLGVWLEITSNLRQFLFICIYDKIFVVTFIVGIILLILQHFTEVQIPDSLNRLHLVRTSIILFVIYYFTASAEGLFDYNDEDEMDNS